MKQKIMIVLRIALGIIFVYASIDKILHPADFAQAVYNYQILPNALINLTALILPMLELIIGLCLISGIWQQGAIVIVNFLLIVFMASLIFNLARGLNIHCGCFTAKPGTIEGNEMVWSILRDIIFLAMGLVLFFDMVMKNRHRDIQAEDESLIWKK